MTSQVDQEWGWSNKISSMSVLSHTQTCENWWEWEITVEMGNNKTYLRWKWPKYSFDCAELLWSVLWMAFWWLDDWRLTSATSTKTPLIDFPQRTIVIAIMLYYGFQSTNCDSFVLLLFRFIFCSRYAAAIPWCTIWFKFNGRFLENLFRYFVFIWNLGLLWFL